MSDYIYNVFAIVPAWARTTFNAMILSTTGDSSGANRPLYKTGSTPNSYCMSSRMRQDAYDKLKAKLTQITFTKVWIDGPVSSDVSSQSNITAGPFDPHEVIQNEGFTKEPA